MLVIDKFIHKAFYKWGIIVYKLRWPMLIIPILITAGLSFGFTRMEELTRNSPEYVFTPTDGKWRFEFDSISDHWPLDNEKFWPGKYFDYYNWNDVIVQPKKEGANILEEKYMNELIRVNKYIIENITVPVEHQSKVYNLYYQDLCLAYGWRCYGNRHLELLQNLKCSDQITGSDNASIFAKEWCEETVKQEVIITYPMARMAGEPIYLASVVSGVRLTDDAGHFDYATTVRLTYNLRQDSTDKVNFGAYSKRWKESLFEYLIIKDTSPLLEFTMTNNDSLPQGMLEVNAKLVPNFVVTFVVLITFATLCSFVILRKDNFIGIDWTRSKPIFALAGLTTAGLGIVSSYGFLLFCGVEYNVISSVMPFLVISIGVDDMFILTAAWHRTDPSQKTKVRLGEAMSEAAVSITITSLTDFLSFAVGCYTVLPGVWMFCAFAAGGIFFNYIYQITFFAAVMAFAGDLEGEGKHSTLFIKTIEPSQADSLLKKIFLTGSHLSQKQSCSVPPTPSSPNPNYDPDEDETLVSKFFRYIYGPILLKPVTKVLAGILFVVLLIVALSGWFQVKEGLNPRFLVLADHHYTAYYDMMEPTFGKQGMQAVVVVNNPPDMRVPEKLERVLAMVADFEDTEHTMDANATVFWYNDFKLYLKALEDNSHTFEPETFYQTVDNWMDFAAGRDLWSNDLEWSEGDTGNITAFRFQVGLRNFDSPNNHKKTTLLMREIAQKYPDYNITTFHQYWPFTDQYIVIVPSLMRNIAICVVCMIIIAFILIPSVPCALLIISAIVSIDISVIGFMSYWGVNLDCVTMITIIMSIGFAVDLSAHISYAYVRAEGTSQQRAIRALETLGWPVFQGAFSTLLGMLVLTTVDAYLVVTFFKTVFLVIVFGLIHSLVFLPIALTLVLPLWERCCTRTVKVVDVNIPGRTASLPARDIYEIENGTAPEQTPSQLEANGNEEEIKDDKLRNSNVAAYSSSSDEENEK